MASGGAAAAALAGKSKEGHKAAYEAGLRKSFEVQLVEFWALHAAASKINDSPHCLHTLEECAEDLSNGGDLDELRFEPGRITSYALCSAARDLFVACLRLSESARRTGARILVKTSERSEFGSSAGIFLDAMSEDRREEICTCFTLEITGYLLCQLFPGFTLTSREEVISVRVSIEATYGSARKSQRRLELMITIIAGRSDGVEVHFIMNMLEFMISLSEKIGAPSCSLDAN